MTVYNITKVIDKSLLNSIKKYLNTDKVTILYTSWSHRFGIKTNNTDINENKLKILNKFLWEKLCDEPITKFTSCPKVDTHNATIVELYGRYSNIGRKLRRF